MYSNTGYITNEDIDIEDYTLPLQVNSCGIYKLLRKRAMRTFRPLGRRDFQLLYVTAGKAHFYCVKTGEEAATGKAAALYDEAAALCSKTFGRTPAHWDTLSEKDLIPAPAGTLILYRPGETQLYNYSLEDAPEVCWVHFTGREADQLLDKIGFADTSLVFCDATNDLKELFQHIIRELQLKRPCCEEILSLYLRQLFCQIERNLLETSTGSYRPSPEIEAAIHYFNESFSQDICIEAYAARRHISTCWFIRSFKRYTGVTPRQYITALRINKAKELLQVTNYSIQEIGNIVGYEDQLYFSRIFKKQTGHAPSWYRR